MMENIDVANTFVLLVYVWNLLDGYGWKIW